MKNSIIALTIAAFALSACAGRVANPVRIIQDGDAALSCAALKQEIQISNDTLTRLVGDQKSVANKNTAAVALGAVIFFPALFFMNLKGAAAEEAKAMQDRIQGLATRHNNKGCTPPIKVTSAADADEAAPAAE